MEQMQGGCLPFSTPSIEESYDKPGKYASVTERYYTPRYAVDLAGKEEDICVLFHSNKMCVVTLAPSHPILKLGKEVENINFQVSTKVDRSKNKVSGRGKRGAQILNAKSALCFVVCTDGTKYTLYSGVQGKLVEINEKLIKNPSLLINKPLSEGYIAIVLPNIEKSKQQKEDLLTPEKYEEFLLSRSKNGNKE